KRHRGTVLAASLLFLVLLGGVIGITIGMVRAKNAEAQATAAREEADGNKRIAEALRDEAIQALDEAEKQKRNGKGEALQANTARHALLIEQATRAWENQDVGEATRFLDKVAA